MRDESIQAICGKFDLKPSQIRAYFHYQPTFYHMHVHFTHENVKQPPSSVDLDQAITNIELMGDYYAKCTLVYSVGVEMPLGKALLEKGAVEMPIV